MINVHYVILMSIHEHELYVDVSEDDATYDKHLDSWDTGKAGKRFKEIDVRKFKKQISIFLPFHQYESNYEL